MNRSCIQVMHTFASSYGVIDDPNSYGVMVNFCWLDGLTAKPTAARGARSESDGCPSRQSTNVVVHGLQPRLLGGSSGVSGCSGAMNCKGTTGRGIRSQQLHEV